MTEPLPRAAHAEHLTDAFHRTGVLKDGRVRDVMVESSRPQFVSNIIRLRLTYDGAANGPSSVILKTGLPHAGGLPAGGHHEVAFYTQVAPAMSGRFVPRCFEAFSDPDTNTWHLLLEDLTDSHFIAAPWPLPPTLEQCGSIVVARARFHAKWWDDPRLGVSVGTWLDADAMSSFLQRLAGQIAKFVDLMGDRLSHERRDLFARLLDAAPRLLARYHSHRNITVVQGDAHVWNNFLPRDGGDDVRLFDWDSWRINVGSTDLARMMAALWYPDQRRWMERQLLDRYHATLMACGVQGYDRATLDDDYRLSVLWQITTPVWLEAAKIPPVIWWNDLERILLTVDDLDCRNLLVG
jgi:hypothetical protein